MQTRLNLELCRTHGCGIKTIRYPTVSESGVIMAEIRFEQVCKFFGATKVIENLDLVIGEGKFTVLVGPSGCGKTTLLRMIAGIGPATSGHLFLDDKDITDLAPAKRDIAMVFQNYAIYPTMTVRENIEFGLKNRRVPKAERDALIDEYAQIVGLTEYLYRKPSTLSGGQRQRIALARAMVKKPKVFLMDEPLSNLDAKLRVAMRVELIELQKRLGTTFVYVTHDQVEAMSMAHQIVLMDKGIIQQEGTPEEIYNDPNNVFTAQFIGTPPMNILSAPEGNSFGFRPEKAVMDHQPLDFFYRRKGRIVTREMLGSETLYKVAIDQEFVMVKSTQSHFASGESIILHVPEQAFYLFDRSGIRIRRSNERVHAHFMHEIGGMTDA